MVVQKETLSSRKQQIWTEDHGIVEFFHLSKDVSSSENENINISGTGVL